MVRVLIADTEASERMGVAASLGTAAGYEVRCGEAFAATAEQIRRAVCDAEVLCVALGRVNADVMDAAPDLRLIVKCGIGVDNIDTGAAQQRGIGVARTSAVNSRGPAEWVIGGVMAHFRRFAALDRAVRVGAWSDIRARWSGLIPALSGRRLGIVGLGAIGQHLSQLGAAHGMEVIAHDPYVTESSVAGARLVDRAELLETADVVSLNVVLTEETRHWLSSAELASMKPTAIVANCSRGPVVDEAALVDALRDGTIAGAVLAVLELEPPTPDNPLFSLEHVLLTPHLAGCTDRGYREIGALAVSVIEEFCVTGTIPQACVVVPLSDARP